MNPTSAWRHFSTNACSSVTLVSLHQEDRLRLRARRTQADENDRCEPKRARKKAHEGHSWTRGSLQVFEHHQAVDGNSLGNSAALSAGSKVVVG
eukprot:m.517607 g.517607  ORF g.517607 m.517607 type:complete len:94 (+) comp57479_c1_seq4:906-1187(+)